MCLYKISYLLWVNNSDSYKIIEIMSCKNTYLKHHNASCLCDNLFSNLRTIFCSKYCVKGK